MTKIIAALAGMLAVVLTLVMLTKCVGYRPPMEPQKPSPAAPAPAPTQPPTPPPLAPIEPKWTTYPPVKNVSHLPQGKPCGLGG